MANVIITIKIMPESPDVDLSAVEANAKKEVEKWGNVGKVEVVPIAFGLKALNIMFIMDEKKGDVEALEKKLSQISGVNSAEVTDVRRAVG